MFAESYRQDAYVTELFGWLKQLKTGKTLSQVVKEIHEDFDEKKKTEKLGKAQEHMLLDVIKILESYEQISKAEHLEAEAEFERERRIQERTSKIRTADREYNQSTRQCI